MRKPFDRILEDCIREIETTGANPESVIARHPDHATELRRHLQIQTTLAASPRAEAPRPAQALGMARLTTALNTTERGGNTLMNDLSRTGGFALKLVGGFAIVAGVILGITYFTGDLDVEFGGEAQANHTHACLDSVAGNLADPQNGHFDINDLIAARQAFEDQNTDPRYDRNADGSVDIDDLMIYIQELKACFNP